jgi:hypothetical protein
LFETRRDDGGRGLAAKQARARDATALHRQPVT